MSASTRPAGIASLFGGVSRTRVLGALAGMSRPVTAYRIARLARVGPPKVYSILRALASAELVATVSLGGSRTGWLLVDPTLRAFLRKRVRILDIDELAYGPRAKSESVARDIERGRPVDLRRYRAEPSRVSNPREYLRSPSKNRILAQLGLPVSIRERKVA